jgi:glucokinase regulatory protein
MINLDVANNKLYYRAVGLISLFSGASEAVAEAAMLRVVYGDDCADKRPDVVSAVRPTDEARLAVVRRREASIVYLMGGGVASENSPACVSYTLSPRRYLSASR